MITLGLSEDDQPPVPKFRNLALPKAKQSHRRWIIFYTSSSYFRQPQIFRHVVLSHGGTPITLNMPPLFYEWVHISQCFLIPFKPGSLGFAAACHFVSNARRSCLQVAKDIPMRSLSIRVCLVAPNLRSATALQFPSMSLGSETHVRGSLFCLTMRPMISLLPDCQWKCLLLLDRGHLTLQKRLYSPFLLEFIGNRAWLLLATARFESVIKIYWKKV